MPGPEDDAGFAGRMALNRGGRAAAILLARAGAKVLLADRESQEH